MDKWDERFTSLAKEVSTWSKDPSTKCGAVVANGKKIISLGFNGFPPSVEDKKEWLEDRTDKLSLVIHAEVNAILNARGSVEGCTLYTYPIAPCKECAKFIVAAGIKRVVSLVDKEKLSRPIMAFHGFEVTEWIFEVGGIQYEDKVI